MDIVFALIRLLGGLALFLYGMDIMGAGLKNSSASVLKKALDKVTSNTFMSFLLGFAITAIIQSSTATIVIVVGLIGAGVLNLRQSAGIVIGANVGTTMTAQIIRLLDIDGGSSAGIIELFKPVNLAPIAAIIGIILFKFIKKNNSRSVGMIALGFGVLFTGLLTMTDSVSPLTGSKAFTDAVASFSSSPTLGLIVGIVVTAIVQSSSASVGILQTLCTSLAATGTGIGFETAFTYTVGAGIGTCIVIFVVCWIGTNEEAKRVFVVHTVFNVIGGALMLAALAVLGSCGVFDFYAGRMMTSSDVANIQMLSRTIVAFIMLPFTSLVLKLSRRLIKDEEVDGSYAEIHRDIMSLDTHLYATPALALAQAKNVLMHMGNVALKNFNAAVSQFDKFDEQVKSRINYREELMDKMADAADNYLLSLSPRIVVDSDNAALNFLMQSITEFERIGDLAVNIAGDAEEMHLRGKKFTESAYKETIIITDAVREIIELTITAFRDEDEEIARMVEPLEEVIDDLQDMMRKHHIERLRHGKCSVSTGITFLDMLVNLERIGDQASNVALLVMASKDHTIHGQGHEYVHRLHEGNDQRYTDYYNKNRDKYVNALSSIIVE